MTHTLEREPKISVGKKPLSVVPEWMSLLPLQQQSVMLLAARGPDGIAKHHLCKNIVRAYRGTVLLAARYGRPLHWGEQADTFMSLDRFSNKETWSWDIDNYFDAVDELPHHYHLHLMHGAAILGRKHPDARFRDGWLTFYARACHDMHLPIETETEMDRRLSDWDRTHWDDSAFPLDNTQ